MKAKELKAGKIYNHITFTCTKSETCLPMRWYVLMEGSLALKRGEFQFQPVLAFANGEMDHDWFYTLVILGSKTREVLQYE